MPSATENNGSPPGMDEAHLLAPWYVAGSLEEAEAREIEELAKHDEDFARFIAETKREAAETVALNEALGEPSPELWARIEASAELAKPARLGLKERAHSLSASLANFLSELTAPQWQAVAAAAVAICVIQAGAIVYLAGEKAPPQYQTASGPKAQTTGQTPAFIVSFVDSASIGDIGKALDEAGAEIVEGPNSDMLYHIALRSDNVDAKAQAYAKLRSSGLLKLILPEK